mgnify:CR=1 FL=1
MGYGQSCLSAGERVNGQADPQSLSRAVIDISSRPFFACQLPFTREKIGDCRCHWHAHLFEGGSLHIVSTEMVSHLLQSFAFEAGVTLHVDCIKGENNHHM